MLAMETREVLAIVSKMVSVPTQDGGVRFVTVYLRAAHQVPPGEEPWTSKRSEAWACEYAEADQLAREHRGAAVVLGGEEAAERVESRRSRVEGLDACALPAERNRQRDPDVLREYQRRLEREHLD